MRVAGADKGGNIFAMEIGNQHNLIVIEPLLVFVSRGDRLGKKVHVIEAGILKGGA